MDIDHTHTSEITCPYCGDKQSDSWECEDSGELYCDMCGNDFSYDRDVSVTYSTEKAKK